MIFLSHNSKDKPIVEPIANRLSEIYGQDKVFYDSWSIQPGEGIIDKMNEGLEKCTLFFFFVSNNSLKSYMVKLEWQNAVMMASKGKTKFVPVRIDDCTMPPILLQTLNIDLYTNGYNVALRQIIDIANGDNTYRQTYSEVSNIEARATALTGREIEMEVLAKYFMEPIPHFLFATPNAKSEISLVCKDFSEYTMDFKEGVVSKSNGTFSNALFFMPPTPLTPDFPFVVSFKAQTEKDISIVSVWHEDKKGSWKQVPFFVRKTN